MRGAESQTPVVTGVGFVTPAGLTRETAWERMRTGESCLGEPQRVDPEAVSKYSVHVTCEVEEFDAADYAEIDSQSMGRYAAFAVAATMQALEDAELDPEGETWNDERTGVSIGSAFGGLDEVLEEYDDERTKVSPYIGTKMLPNLAAGHVGILTGARGPNRAPATACAAGTHAIDTAVADLLRERADVMLVGATEAVVNYYGISVTAAPRAYTNRRSLDAVRPFDESRDGLTIGEGAAMLVVETEEHARRRGVEPYARITGVGATGDGHHAVSPPEDGNGLRRSMEMALDDADVSPDAVDYVNAHGTATVAGDRAEASAIERVFGTETPITSVKGSIGHTYGAAGAIDAAMSVLSIRDGCIPATANFETSEEEIGTPVVAQLREQEVETVVSNSAGFGGTNGSVVLERPE